MSKTYSYTRVTTHSNGLPPKSPVEEPPVYSPVYSSVFRTPLRSSTSSVTGASSTSSRAPTTGASNLGAGDDSDLLSFPPADPPPLLFAETPPAVSSQRAVPRSKKSK